MFRSKFIAWALAAALAVVAVNRHVEIDVMPAWYVEDIRS